MPAGISTVVSRYTVDESVNKLKGMLSDKGIKPFCVVDHSGEAAAVGIHMRPTKLLIFGSARAGTPLMTATPSTALDLPLRILVAEAGDSRVSLSWNQPLWLQQRHQFPLELLSHLSMAETLSRELAELEPIEDSRP